MRTLTSLAAVCGVATVLLFDSALPPMHRVGAAPALRAFVEPDAGVAPVVAFIDAARAQLDSTAGASQKREPCWRRPHHFQDQHFAVAEAGFDAGTAPDQLPADLLVPVIDHGVDGGKERIIRNVRTGHGTSLRTECGRLSGALDFCSSAAFNPPHRSDLRLTQEKAIQFPSSELHRLRWGSQRVRRT